MSDWWQTSTSTSTNFQTPTRPFMQASTSSHPHAQSTSRARFAGDELDPEDAKMADGVKFMPAFSAASPASRMGMSQSPGQGGQSGQSPQYSTMGTGGKMSPRARFTPGAGGESSPRSTRPRQTLIPTSADDDGPPTTSLRDPANQSQSPPSLPSSLSLSASLPLPQSLLSSSSTTSLHVFGPPTDFLSSLRPFFDQIGHVLSYTAGPRGSNWFIVEFSSAEEASWCLRKHGDIINGKWMLGLKVVRPGSTAGCTLVDGYDTGVGEGIVVQGSGTPLRIQDRDVTRPTKMQAVINRKEEYGWEGEEESKGWMSTASVFIFGR